MQKCPCDLFDPQKYKGKPYQQTPCASCFLTKETTNTNKHSKLFDADGAIDQPLIRNQYKDITNLIGQELTEDVLKTIVDACQHNTLITLSNIVLKLVKLAKQSPVMFNILQLKMQHPQLSYYQIGQTLDPPCSKQNVLYHLSHAVRQFPQLQKAIFTDSRFSGGKYALRSIVNTSTVSKKCSKIRRLIYDQTNINKQKTLDQLKDQLSNLQRIQNITIYDSYKD